MDDVLVMTGSIIVPDGVMNHKKIKHEERLRQYIRAIVYYIIFSDFHDIVFIDGNDFDMTELSFLGELADNYGKKIELLSFKNDQIGIVKKGKGFGEQKIMEYIVNNSALLKSHKSFYKVTGRYIVKNINKILLNEKKYEFRFFRGYYGGEFHCNTAFFKCTKELFQNVLCGCGEEVDEKKGILLEHVYYYRLKKQGIKSHFKELPEFSGDFGVGGSLDKSYSQLMIKRVLNKLGFFSL